MVDPVTSQRWGHWILLSAISAFVLFTRLIPLDLSAGMWPGPDWIVAISFAWVLRRRDFVPTPLLAIILLIFDLMLMRPPGLWAALAICGLEFLRSRSVLSRDLPFLLEWALVSIVLVAMTIANRLILAVFVTGQPEVGKDALLLTATILVYPLVVLISSRVLGVSKVAPGEVDKLGHRL
ncbi:MAG: rod shape-determining protein MreD [Marinosulfonomonas sp.]|nr:rod shape-determining protein MreD [Marinosulfonomonas sp.]